MWRDHEGSPELQARDVLNAYEAVSGYPLEVALATPHSELWRLWPDVAQRLNLPTTARVCNLLYQYIHLTADLEQQAQRTGESPNAYQKGKLQGLLEALDGSGRGGLPPLFSVMPLAARSGRPSAAGFLSPRPSAAGGLSPRPSAAGGPSARPSASAGPARRPSAAALAAMAGWQPGWLDAVTGPAAAGRHSLGAAAAAEAVRSPTPAAAGRFTAAAGRQSVAGRPAAAARSPTPAAPDRPSGPPAGAGKPSAAGRPAAAAGKATERLAPAAEPLARPVAATAGRPSRVGNAPEGPAKAAIERPVMVGSKRPAEAAVQRPATASSERPAAHGKPAAKSATVAAVRPPVAGGTAAAGKQPLLKKQQAMHQTKHAGLQAPAARPAAPAAQPAAPAAQPAPAAAEPAQRAGQQASGMIHKRQRLAPAAAAPPAQAAQRPARRDAVPHAQPSRMDVSGADTWTEEDAKLDALLAATLQAPPPKPVPVNKHTLARSFPRLWPPPPPPAQPTAAGATWKDSANRARSLMVAAVAAGVAGPVAQHSVPGTAVAGVAGGLSGEEPHAAAVEGGGLLGGRDRGIGRVAGLAPVPAAVGSGSPLARVANGPAAQGRVLASTPAGTSKAGTDMAPPQFSSPAGTSTAQALERRQPATARTIPEPPRFNGPSRAAQAPVTAASPAASGKLGVTSPVGSRAAKVLPAAGSPAVGQAQPVARASASNERPQPQQLASPSGPAGVAPARPEQPKKRTLDQQPDAAVEALPYLQRNVRQRTTAAPASMAAPIARQQGAGQQAVRPAAQGVASPPVARPAGLGVTAGLGPRTGGGPSTGTAGPAPAVCLPAEPAPVAGLPVGPAGGLEGPAWHRSGQGQRADQPGNTTTQPMLRKLLSGPSSHRAKAPASGLPSNTVLAKMRQWFNGCPQGNMQQTGNGAGHQPAPTAPAVTATGVTGKRASGTHAEQHQGLQAGAWLNRLNTKASAAGAGAGAPAAAAPASAVAARLEPGAAVAAQPNASPKTNRNASNAQPAAPAVPQQGNGSATEREPPAAIRRQPGATKAVLSLLNLPKVDKQVGHHRHVHSQEPASAQQPRDNTASGLAGSPQGVRSPQAGKGPAVAQGYPSPGTVTELSPQAMRPPGSAGKLSARAMPPSEAALRQPASSILPPPAAQMQPPRRVSAPAASTRQSPQGRPPSSAALTLSPQASAPPPAAARDMSSPSATLRPSPQAVPPPPAAPRQSPRCLSQPAARARATAADIQPIIAGLPEFPELQAALAAHAQAEAANAELDPGAAAAAAAVPPVTAASSHAVAAAAAVPSATAAAVAPAVPAVAPIQLPIAAASTILRPSRGSPGVPADKRVARNSQHGIPSGPATQATQAGSPHVISPRVRPSTFLNPRPNAIPVSNPRLLDVKAEPEPEGPAPGPVGLVPPMPRSGSSKRRQQRTTDQLEGGRTVEQPQAVSARRQSTEETEDEPVVQRPLVQTTVAEAEGGAEVRATVGQLQVAAEPQERETVVAGPQPDHVPGGLRGVRHGPDESGTARLAGGAAVAAPATGNTTPRAAAASVIANTTARAATANAARTAAGTAGPSGAVDGAASTAVAAAGAAASSPNAASPSRRARWIWSGQVNITALPAEGNAAMPAAAAGSGSKRPSDAAGADAAAGHLSDAVRKPSGTAAVRSPGGQVLTAVAGTAVVGMATTGTTVVGTAVAALTVAGTAVVQAAVTGVAGASTKRPSTRAATQATANHGPSQPVYTANTQTAGENGQAKSVRIDRRSTRTSGPAAVENAAENGQVGAETVQAAAENCHAAGENGQADSVSNGRAARAAAQAVVTGRRPLGTQEAATQAREESPAAKRPKRSTRLTDAQTMSTTLTMAQDFTQDEAGGSDQADQPPAAAAAAAAASADNHSIRPTKPAQRLCDSADDGKLGPSKANSCSCCNGAGQTEGSWPSGMGSRLSTVIQRLPKLWKSKAGKAAEKKKDYMSLIERLRDQHKQVPDGWLCKECYFYMNRHLRWRYPQPQGQDSAEEEDAGDEAGDEGSDGSSEDDGGQQSAAATAALPEAVSQEEVAAGGQTPRRKRTSSKAMAKEVAAGTNLDAQGSQGSGQPAAASSQGHRQRAAGNGWQSAAVISQVGGRRPAAGSSQGKGRQAAVEDPDSTVEQAAAEQAAAEQVVLGRAAAEQALAEQKAAEQAAAEQVVLDWAAAEQVLVEQAAAEQALAEQEAAEQEAAEQVVLDWAAAEQVLIEQAAAEQALAEQEAAEQAALEQAALEQAAAAVSSQCTGRTTRRSARASAQATQASQDTADIAPQANITQRAVSRRRRLAVVPLPDPFISCAPLPSTTIRHPPTAPDPTAAAHPTAVLHPTAAAAHSARDPEQHATRQPMMVTAARTGNGTHVPSLNGEMRAGGQGAGQALPSAAVAGTGAPDPERALQKVIDAIAYSTAAAFHTEAAEAAAATNVEAAAAVTAAKAAEAAASLAVDAAAAAWHAEEARALGTEAPAEGVEGEDDEIGSDVIAAAGLAAAGAIAAEPPAAVDAGTVGRSPLVGPPPAACARAPAADLQPIMAGLGEFPQLQAAVAAHAQATAANAGLSQGAAAVAAPPAAATSGGPWHAAAVSGTPATASFSLAGSIGFHEPADVAAAYHPFLQASLSASWLAPEHPPQHPLVTCHQVQAALSQLEQQQPAHLPPTTIPRTTESHAVRPMQAAQQPELLPQCLEPILLPQQGNGEAAVPQPGLAVGQQGPDVNAQPQAGSTAEPGSTSGWQVPMGVQGLPLGVQGASPRVQGRQGAGHPGSPGVPGSAHPGTPGASALGMHDALLPGVAVMDALDDMCSPLAFQTQAGW